MVYGQVARKLSRPKSCRPKPESCCPNFIVMSPEILSHVVINFIECLNLKKSNILMLTRETQVVRFAVVWYYGDSNPKTEHGNKKNYSNISYSMVLTVVVLSVEAFCFERRFTSLRLEHWKTPPSWIQHVVKNHHVVAKQECDVAVNSDTH